MGKVKMKTNRSAAKRFKITAKGKIKRWKSGFSHYSTKKSSKKKRQGKRPTLVKENMEKHVKALLKEF